MPTLVELAELEEAAKHEACRPHRRVVQSEEMNDADRLFVKIDTNESGTIDADELLKHLLEVGVDTDEISRAFAAIDTDGDGAITKEEWTAGYARYLAADETLDPTKPLRAPHFRHTDLRAFCFSWKPTAARTASFASDQATVSSVIFGGEEEARRKTTRQTQRRLEEELLV